MSGKYEEITVTGFVKVKKTISVFLDIYETEEEREDKICSIVENLTEDDLIYSSPIESEIVDIDWEYGR